MKSFRKIKKTVGEGLGQKGMRDCKTSFILKVTKERLMYIFIYIDLIFEIKQL